MAELTDDDSTNYRLSPTKEAPQHSLETHSIQNHHQTSPSNPASESNEPSTNSVDDPSQPQNLETQLQTISSTTPPPRQSSPASTFAATYDWASLQASFEEAMAACTAQERELHAQWTKLTQMYAVWAASGPAHEEQRATKRLRTRVAYVAHEEGQLVAQDEHRQRVVSAFEDALKLLQGVP